MTIIDQDTALSSLSVTSQCDKILDPNIIAPFHPSLLTSFVQVTPPQVPDQGYSLAPSYQDGSQVYYYNHNSLDHLIPRESGQYLQPYSSVSYPVSKESAPQPEMLMVGKEIQPRNVQIPISNSGFSYSTSDQIMPNISLLGKYKLGRERHMIKSPRMLKSTFQ